MKLGTKWARGMCTVARIQPGAGKGRGCHVEAKPVWTSDICGFRMFFKDGHCKGISKRLAWIQPEATPSATTPEARSAQCESNATRGSFCMWTQANPGSCGLYQGLSRWPCANPTNTGNGYKNDVYTMNSAKACHANYRVFAKACNSCPAGTPNAKGDDAADTNTNCDAIVCSANKRVSGHACITCSAGVLQGGAWLLFWIRHQPCDVAVFWASGQSNYEVGVPHHPRHGHCCP